MKHLELQDLRVNMKIRIRSLDDEKGFVMIIHRINGTEITAVMKHSGPIGGDPFRFTFYARDATFSDGTGRALLIERFAR